MKPPLSSTAAESDRSGPNAPSTNGRSEDGSSPLSILLIDDNPRIAESLAIAIDLAGHRLDVANGPEEGFSRLAARRYDAILLDLNYAAGRTDGGEGLTMLARLLADDPAACIIVITAHSGIRLAVTAMQAGARDFVMKPWRNAELIAKIEVAVRRRPAPADQAHIADAPSPAADPVRLLGDSAAIEHVRTMIRRIAPTMAGVVVTGPSGAGRSLIAAAIHAASAGADRPMTRIDLRDPLAWERLDGSGNGATWLLRHPDQLDAIGQARLLDRLSAADRFIAIADDARAITPGLARRIATVEIAAPSLDQRRADIPVLARHFARVAAERHGRPLPRFTPAAEALFATAHWPDEARGLAAAIERALLLGDDGVIEAALLAPAAPIASAAAPGRVSFDLDETERTMIEAALVEHHHNVTQAAHALGLSRGALYRRMARHGL
ncbi:sigma-54 dependent transcriptional regulator [Sphingomonas sp. SORGH_AS_0879]|uniref:sigma-54-dependent transcriptional regulator n=1 Tax=Sphingomonas sp. SORGH_AS_0879 TaxID=3041790 RepID=UPI0027829085|nr:response regulator [Sphingomonas sp. SORGH_AS_0879]MDQ1231366.1 DNA-binding NtrC family response regulator [Sphingomonas sp. SORGH_AS_0879]